MKLNETAICGFGSALIAAADIYDKAVREKNLQHTQDFIEWQDALNEISVR